MVAAAGAGMGEHPGLRVIDGRELKITTPGRVLYPATGTTKTDVLDYYVLRTTVAVSGSSPNGRARRVQLSGQALSRARAVPLLPSW
jgi:hypothetical protein